jgi:hypothetical protein
MKQERDDSMMKTEIRSLLALIVLAGLTHFRAPAQNSLQPVVPKSQRGSNDAERSGTHDAGNIRTIFWNYGMVGDYPPDPIHVDLSVFHSVEVPKGSGLNYADGITPFVLASVMDGVSPAFIMETGYRERQDNSPHSGKVMRFEPRPGYFQADPSINRGRSIAISSDSRTWPESWPDKANDPNDPGWPGSWNGYFGKRPNADQESFFVMDDDYYDRWDHFFPDSRDATRRGLGLRVEVRGFQWANPQATNVIFWHYDITNEGTTDYHDNIIFGLYMDSGVGGSAISCDGVAESDDDNAFFDRSTGLNLVYTWDKYGHGVDLTSTCAPTGYLGYAYMETPGNPYDLIDNDSDGITDERRDSGPGTKIVGQDNIRAYVNARYNMANFEAFYGKLENRPAFKEGIWWTGDENMNWDVTYDDLGADGVPGTHDLGEGDGIPTAGEPDFDQTDKDESDQIGLTGFQMNRIKGPSPADPVDAIVFFGIWPPVLYQKWTDPVPANRFDVPVVLNYNIAFLFASGTFRLPPGDHERFSLALAYGGDLSELKTVVRTVQQIYNANYQFAVPPPIPTATAETGDHYVRVMWTDVSERGIDPVTRKNDFEGYRVYRSTDPEFRDPRVITNALGTDKFGNGVPMAQFDLVNGIKGFSNQQIEGVHYWLGTDSGLMHSFTDTTVKNGQEYFYAVCAYGHGDDSLGFFPSENAITVSRTLRGGTVLPVNVVDVRPEPAVPGYTQATATQVRHIAGTGSAAIGLTILDSKSVPDNTTLLLRFTGASPGRRHAVRYELADSLSGKAVYSFGADFHGEGRGPVGDGILAVVSTPDVASFDSVNSGFALGNAAHTPLTISNLSRDSIDVSRPGYPYDFTLTFSATPIDTSLFVVGAPSVPVKFRAVANTPSGPVPLKCALHEDVASKDSTLSLADEWIDVYSYFPWDTARFYAWPTWRVRFNTPTPASSVVPPAPGDVYTARITSPVANDDVYAFTTKGQLINPGLAKQQYRTAPYVVPNPYAGAASFEPQKFATTGRGDRRMEFRGLPVNATVRIYTVRGDLVQTLRQDGSTSGYAVWDLRTKDNLDVAPGLYIFHVEAVGFDSYVGKFAIIK